MALQFIGGWRRPAREAQMQVRALFADDAALERGRAWAISVLQDAGIDPVDQPVRGIKALRAADRRLTLIAGRYLVDLAAGRADGRDGGPADQAGRQSRL